MTHHARHPRPPMRTRPAVVAVALLAASSPSLRAQDARAVDQAATRLAWRSIGPTNEAGRVSVIVGVPGDYKTVYVAGANGGIFRTTNAGVTWEPIFDAQESISIGAIAVAPSDPIVLWAGT